MTLNEEQTKLLVSLYETYQQFSETTDALNELIDMELVVPYSPNTKLRLTFKGLGLINSLSIGNLSYRPTVLARSKLTEQEFECCIFQEAKEGYYKITNLFMLRVVEYLITEGQLGRRTVDDSPIFYFRKGNCEIELSPGDALLFNPSSGEFVPTFKETLDLFLNLYYLDT